MMRQKPYAATKSQSKQFSLGNSATPKIMVVDGNELVLETVADILGDTYIVIGHQSPLSALAELKAHNVEVLLVDLKMDKMLSFDFIREAKSIQSCLAVIVMTACSGKDQTLATLKEFSCGLLEKPLTPVCVMKSVKNACKMTINELEKQSLLAQLQCKNLEIEKYRNHLKKQASENIDALNEIKEEAEKAVAIRSEFLANMSHEIRTPLNGMIGITQLMQVEKLTTEQHEMVQTLDDSCHHLLDMIDGVLDFSKLEFGKIQLERVTFDLRALVQSVVQLFWPRALQKSVEVILDYIDDCPSQVYGDPIRLRQILNNFLDNALKFTTIGTIVLKVESLRQSNKLLFVKISVSDTGIGIAKDKQALIFDKFAQADGSTTRRFGGTGLGLAICELLVTAMDGEIGVDSMPGEGSTFWFALTYELDQDKQDQAESSFAAEISSQTPSVLVVSNNSYYCDLFAKYLTHWNLNHTFLANMKTLEEKLTQGERDNAPFHIVFLECYRGNQQVLQLGEAIKQNPTLNKVNLVLVNSDGLRGDAGRFKNAGFAGYLSKPIYTESLKGMITMLWHNIVQGKPKQFITRLSLTGSQSMSRRSKDFVRLGRNPQILLAEDNEVNRKILCKILQRMGCVVVMAQNGLEVIQNVEAKQFDLILMDCQMPLMDGFKATIKLREIEYALGRPAVPIVAITASTSDGIEERCTAVGMDSYLTKPLQNAKLAKVLIRYFGQAVGINSKQA